MRCITLKEVMSKVGRGKSTIYRDIALGTFPDPLKAGNSSLWIESEIEEWICSTSLNSRGILPLHNSSLLSISVVSILTGYDEKTLRWWYEEDMKTLSPVLQEGVLMYPLSAVVQYLEETPNRIRGKFKH